MLNTEETNEGSSQVVVLIYDESSKGNSPCETDTGDVIVHHVIIGGVTSHYF